MNPAEIDGAFRLREALIQRALAGSLEYVYSADSMDKKIDELNWQVVMRRTVPALVQGCQIVVWRREFWRIAVSGSRSFSGLAIRSEDLGMDGDNGLRAPQLWVVPKPENPDLDGVAIRTATENQMILRAIIVDFGFEADGHELQIAASGRGPLVSEELPLLPTGLICWPIVESLDRATLGLIANQLVSPGNHWTGPNSYLEVIAGIHFLRSKFVSVEGRQLSRSTRKLAARRKVDLPEVRVVNLRRPADHGERDDAQGRNYQHQWIVGWPHGHWRRQWYPSLGEHRPKLISPYRKGPEGAPLMMPRETVAKVVR